ncbi:MAG: Hsp20/alpha crystallin family protein [Desulfovibrionaceae bacterium]
MPDLRLWSEQELARMRRDVDRLFENLRQDLGLAGRRCVAPGRAQLIDEGEALVVRVEIPGCAARNLDVVLHEQELMIAFQRKDRIDHARRVTSGSRRLRLPCRVDVEQAEARLSDGVLKVRAPKLRGPRGRRLDVVSD